MDLKDKKASYIDVQGVEHWASDDFWVNITEQDRALFRKVSFMTDEEFKFLGESRVTRQRQLASQDYLHLLLQTAGYAKDLTYHCRPQADGKPKGAGPKLDFDDNTATIAGALIKISVEIEKLTSEIAKLNKDK